MEEGFHEFVVSPAEAGLRLDVLLGRRFPRDGRADWQGRIRDGRARIGGKIVRPARRVNPGDQISFSFHKRTEPEVSTDFRIVLEDEHVIVLDKPTNLPVHPSGIYHRNTLSELLKNKFGADFQARFVSRLDRETSGLLVMGRSRDDARLLALAQRRGEFLKDYFVVVEGAFPAYLDAVGVLGPDPESEVRKKRRFFPANPNEGGQSDPKRTPQKKHSGLIDETPGPLRETARTEFFLVNQMKDTALLRARLHTGRMHQIRATLVSLGYPVTGDRLYGVDDSMYLRFIHGNETDDDRRRLRIDRTALHSASVEFPHPGTNERTRVESPLPADIEVLLA